MNVAVSGEHAGNAEIGKLLCAAFAVFQQIAGRAGRYGLYDVGYVNAYGFKGVVAQALNKPLRPLTDSAKRCTLPAASVPRMA